MNITVHTARASQLVRALETLARRGTPAAVLLEELAGITVLVARKFTNERTADGLQEAHYLTIGCISLGLGLAEIPHTPQSELDFLLKTGAEQVFQTGFRHIRELAGMPLVLIITAYDNDPVILQRNIKSLFSELCRAEPLSNWTGDQDYNKLIKTGRENQTYIDCAKWLRKRHYTGAVNDPLMDASAVVFFALLFAILNDGRIVTRAKQKDIENLIRSARKIKPDIEAGWEALLKKIPTEYQPILRQCMDEYRNTLIKKILSKVSIKSVVNNIIPRAGMELEVDNDMLDELPDSDEF